MRTVFLLLASVCALNAADWPQWRGENRQNISPDKGLLREWPKDGPRLLWKATGLGSGYSTVSVVQDRIYTAGDAQDSSYVHALDAKGKKVWSSRLGRHGERGGYQGPRAQPTVSEGAVFMLGQFGDLVCYEVMDGKERWRKNLASDFGGMVGGWGYSESVLIDGEQLICTPGGRQGTMLALSTADGAELWRTREITDNAEYVSPVIATIGGVKQYVQMTGKSVFGVATDGKMLWRAERKGRTATIPTPIVHNDLVYVTSGYGVGCNGFKITREEDAFKAEQVYTNRFMVNHHGGVVRIGDYLYGHSEEGGWTCQKFQTGEKMWQKSSVGKGSVTAADGLLILRSEGRNGTVALVKASPDEYKELGRFDQPDRTTKNSWSHPVVVNGRLYLRDQQTLYCYGVK
jgi:outer membrane protein assembly factor BamB